MKEAGTSWIVSMLNGGSHRFRVRAAIVTVGCVIVIGMAGPVRADDPTQNASLAGINRAILGGSQLTADGAGCGLALDHLLDTVREPVIDAGLELTGDAATRLTLSAVTARFHDGQCATAVLLGAYARESYFSATTGWLGHGYVVLWQRSMMVATPQADHKSAVDAAARRLAMQMLAQRAEQTDSNRAVAAGSPASRPKPTP